MAISAISSTMPRPNPDQAQLGKHSCRRKALLEILRVRRWETDQQLGTERANHGSKERPKDHPRDPWI